MRIKPLIVLPSLFLAGLLCGGYLFSQSTPRSFLAFNACQQRCYNANELAGLITSAALLRAPFAIPGVVLESDTCLAIRHTKPQARIHYVLFPKHDTRNLATLTVEDSPYVLGCFAMVRDLVARDKLGEWRVHTNGPGYQEIAYLHFHLVAE